MFLINKKPNLFIMKKNITKVAALALIAMASSFDASAQLASQQNLGEACGCPTVASRPTVSMSTLATIGGANDGDLIATNTILTCDKTYILDNKIYVPAGKTLTIQPGTVIKGAATGTTLAANAILVMRDGKIFASGTESCPIIFTAQADPLDGTYPLTNKGQWGGIVVLGKATNNLTTAANYSATGAAGFFGTAQVGGLNTVGGGDGVGFIEGFTAADARNLYGMPPGQQDDNDNSGVLRYVSIRHAGASVGANNELNGLTLGSVGRGTTIENLEVVSNDDDGVEPFGGTVNLKYLSLMFNNDDNFDYDQGYSGKVQFMLSVKLDAATFTGGDSGLEIDGDDNKANPAVLSNATIYNSTFIGNGSNTTPTGGGSGPWAINAKEKVQGTIRSSIFANYRSGMNLIKSMGARTGNAESYHNWRGIANDNTTAITPTLIVECNTFVGNTASLTVGGSTANLVAGDDAKFLADGNVVAASVAGLDFNFAASGTTVSDQYNAVPNPQLTSTCVPPADGFFVNTNYRGAFKPGQTSWLSNWSYSALLDATNGLVPCATDINKDGITNTLDFLDLVGQFNQSCD
jgi:hypothetical protein